MSAAPREKGGFIAYMMKHLDLLFTFGMFGVVVLLVLPVPPALMDLLLAASIGFSLLVLLIVIYVKEPSEFNVFPTVLLAVTLFRLGLNVASTRLILLDGYAGNVIESFGSYVVRGNYVVGVVVFCILVVINFMVITKGAGRIAEVAARFTLDAMPGKQMSIDAELNAGIIDETEATTRRMKIQKEADFYGAMDGASKFVRGDAVAGILITLINVVGGIAIGAWQKGLPLMEALQKYTLLSIGDGLVSQIPALIVSMGAGILVTRTGEGDDLGKHLGKQLSIYPRAMGVAAAMLCGFAFLPGMPFVPFAVLGGTCGSIAFLLSKRARNAEAAKPAKAAATDSDAPAAPKPGSTEDLQQLIQTDTFAVEMGYGLLALADQSQGGDLLKRITGVRQKFAREMGLILPAMAVRDNLELETNEYRFLVRGKEVARGSSQPNRWLAMNVSGSDTQLKGVPTVEPVFGLDAFWIADEERKNAEIAGFTVVDASSVMITHLSEVLAQCGHMLLEREDTQRLLDLVKEKNPTLVSELVPEIVSVGLFQRVCQNLLRERVSIRQLSLILEIVGDFSALSKNPDDLSEQVRRRLGAYFIEDYESKPGLVEVITFEPQLEQVLAQRVKRTQFEVGLMMDPELTEHILTNLRPALEAMTEEGLEQCIMVSADIRLPLKRFFEPSFPRMAVLAFQEVPTGVRVESRGMLPLPNAQIPAEQVA